MEETQMTSVTMRQYQMKYLFLGLGIAVVVMTVVMHVLIGDAGMNVLHEIMSPEVDSLLPVRSHDHHDEVPFLIRDDPVRRNSSAYQRRADYAAQKGIFTRSVYRRPVNRYLVLLF